jgi:hypothetical protein
MARVDVPYVQRFKDRHGKVRHYFRQPGFPRTPSRPRRPEFRRSLSPGARADQAACSGLPDKPWNARRAAGGILPVRRLPQPKGQHPDQLPQRAGADARRVRPQPRCVDLTKQAVREMLKDRADTPGAQRIFLKRLRQVLDLAVELDWLATTSLET